MRIISELKCHLSIESTEPPLHQAGHKHVLCEAARNFEEQPSLRYMSWSERRRVENLCPFLLHQSAPESQQLHPLMAGSCAHRLGISERDQLPEELLCMDTVPKALGPLHGSVCYDVKAGT